MLLAVAIKPRVSSRMMKSPGAYLLDGSTPHEELQLPVGEWISFCFFGALILCMISLGLVWVKKGRFIRTALAFATISLAPGILQVMLCMIIYDGSPDAGKEGALLTGPVWTAFFLPVAPLVVAIQLVWFWGFMARKSVRAETSPEFFVR